MRVGRLGVALVSFQIFLTHFGIFFSSKNNGNTALFPSGKSVTEDNFYLRLMTYLKINTLLRKSIKSFHFWFIVVRKLRTVIRSLDFGHM